MKLRLLSFLAKYWFGVRVVLMCVLWYSCSSGLSIVNKLTLQTYPYPLTIALSSFLNNVIYAIPLIKLLHIQPVKISTGYVLRTIVPISLGRAVAVASAYFGLYKVPVSYAQTVKATMPVFTVLISRVLLNERQARRVYASLTPIILGVFVASVTELQFDGWGLVSSLLSTAVFAYLNVLAKKVFEETGMHPVFLLSLNSQMASVVLFPVWLFRDGWTMWQSIFADVQVNEGLVAPDANFLVYLCASGIFSFAQNLCAFALIHQLTTLSYAVSSAAKRIFVILLSLATLRNPVTGLNVCGMMISILGVFLYNLMKSREKSGDDTHNRHVLPTTHNGKSSIEANALLRRKGFDMTNLRSSPSDVNLLLSTP